MVLVFAGNLAAGLYQQFGDRQFVVLRLPRPTGHGVSGLFWHWNNLAALLAITLPLFLGVALSTRRTAVRLLFLLLVVAGLVLAYLSKSRAGFGAVVIGLGTVGLVLLLQRSRSWSWSARLATWTGVGLAGIAAAVAVFLVASRVSEARGHGADLSEALGKSSRLHLAGVAFDLWFDEPLTGNGSQSYKYLLVKNWDREVLPLWLGNPETVHNEYMQVLCDYGLIGFVLLMGFLLVVLGRVLVGRGTGDLGGRSLLTGLQLGAVGGLIGAMAHATVEFQLHLLPILLPAAAAVGLLGQDRRAGTTLSRVFQAATVAAAAILAVVVVGRENMTSLKWVQWDLNKVRSGGKLEASRLPEFKSLVMASPHYQVALAYGRMNFSAYLRSGEEDPKLLEEAHWALEIAYRRNPFDQMTLVSYGLVLDRLGRFEDALPVHLQAIEMAAARENKYGALGGMSLHLFERGQKLWMARQPGEALGYFLRSRDYLEASRTRKGQFGGSNDYTARKGVLESRITLLQTSGIEARIPSDVPPAPEDW